MTSYTELFRYLAFFALTMCISKSATGLVVERTSPTAAAEAVNQKGHGRTISQRHQKPKSSVADSTPVVLGNSTRMTVKVSPKRSTLILAADEGRWSVQERAVYASVTIRCRTKCIVSKVQDLPTVSFYLEIANATVLPMSSGFPGVSIYTTTSERRMQRPYGDNDDHRAVATFRSDTHLAIDASAHSAILRKGDNRFYCRAYSPSLGPGASDYFVIHRR